MYLFCPKRRWLVSECHPAWTHPLSPLFSPNSPSAYIHGEQITDTIASWIHKGFVAGPFHNPPYPNFRANPLLAIPQHDKVRLVLNLSAPTGASYNDYLDKFTLPRTPMSSARRFSFALWSHWSK